MPFNYSRGAATGFKPLVSEQLVNVKAITFFNSAEILFNLPARPVAAHSSFSDFSKSLDLIIALFQDARLQIRFPRVSLGPFGHLPLGGAAFLELK
jgi:hypothetical protein